MFLAVMDGATDPSVSGVEVVARAALAATATDVLAADGYILGSPVNLGYLSGALKHFFDQIYYPCLEDTRARPYAAYLHSNLDATGAVRALDAIAAGLRWRQVHPLLQVAGAPSQEELDACRELGATVAARLLLDA
jgi:NAD(P)H-dependent FMN reductase